MFTSLPTYTLILPHNSSSHTIHSHTLTTHRHTPTLTNTHNFIKLQPTTTKQTDKLSINMSRRSTNQTTRGMTRRESSAGMSRDDRLSRNTSSSRSHGTHSRGAEMSVYNDSSRMGDRHHELSRRREDSDSDYGHGQTYASAPNHDAVWSTMRAMGIKPEAGKAYGLNADGTLSITAAPTLSMGIIEPPGYGSSGGHGCECRHIGHDSYPANHHAGQSRSSRLLEVPSSSRHESRQLAITDGRSSHSSSRHGHSHDDRSSHSSSRHGHSHDDRSSHSSSRPGHSIDGRESRSSRRSTGARHSEAQHTTGSSYVGSIESRDSTRRR